MTKRVKLTESDLRRIIKEAVQDAIIDSQTPSDWNVRVNIPMKLDLFIRATSEEDAIEQARRLLKTTPEEDFDVDFDNPKIVAIPADLFGKD